MAATSIRKLIEQALNEARDEFAAIVQRKLEALMGDAEPPARRAAVAGQRTHAAPTAPRRKRTPGTAMAELRARVLAAMPLGEPLKKSRILELAGLGEADEARVSNLLRKLKDEGVLSMRGAKATATWIRKS